MREAIREFAEEFPKYGAILEGKIAEKRAMKEKHLYFGTNPESRLTADDYMEVMQNLGLSEATSRSLYQELMTVSRKLKRAREGEERSVIVGKENKEDEE